MTELQRIDELTKPGLKTVKCLQETEGDIMVLGAGGKMGPSLIGLLQRALEENEISKKIYAVSRFSNDQVREECKGYNTTIIQGDLLENNFLTSLPSAKNILYLVGHKFGTSDNQGLTWAMNAYLPGQVIRHFPQSNIVAFSTGNVYAMTPTHTAGASEEFPLGPVGEYAQSCLGRERVFSYFSNKNKTPLLLYRLNYALDLRYGVLNDIGQRVYADLPIDLKMGFVNVIWQGDANNYAIQCLQHCTSPPSTINITGPNVISVRDIATEFANLFGKEVKFENTPKDTALLSNASKAMALFGEPRISLSQMIEWSAEWIATEGQQLNKPTHFQERSGIF